MPMAKPAAASSATGRAVFHDRSACPKSPNIRSPIIPVYAQAASFVMLES
jgi:hypothetical protein